MRIKKIAIGKLRPYANNPRRNENAVGYVENSIHAFGFRVPVVVDRNNEIIAGHTRFLAAKKEGLEEIPCVVADDLTEEQAAAFRLVDNKTQELSEWDWKKIGEELDAIQGIDMRLMGFEEFLDEPDRNLPERKIGQGSEIDPDSFEDEAFSLTCPCCGFRFNE